MKFFQYIILTGCICCILQACGKQRNAGLTATVQHSIDVNELIEITETSQFEYIDGMIMQELQFLRNSVYAGKLPEALTPEELTLVERINNRMSQLQQENYIYTEADTTANILNVVNMFLFRELINHQEVMDDLAVDNYALLPDSLLQLFQIYQKNDSLQIPNFVTADLMAQLSHVYENCLLRTVEEKYFAPMMADLCLSLYTASVGQANSAAREDIKNMAAFNAAFFAVPYNLLTGKSLKTQGDYPAIVETELAYIAQQESRRPALLDLRTDFDYNVFGPYGHYTRTAAFRRYFKAWKWLQLAPFCCDNKIQIQQAVLIALALQTAKTSSGVSAIDVYSQLTGALEWFTGPPAGTSVLDVALLLKKERITTISAALDAKFLAKASAIIRNTAADKVKYPAVCRNGIYFMPQPILPDTSSALQVKMKHNILLNGFASDHPELFPIVSPNDTLPKPPIPGYVEPSLPFWTKLRERVELTDKTLKDYRLTSDTLTVFSERMYRYVALMEDATRRELNNERLPDETYRFIAHIGDSVQQFTHAMIEPDDVLYTATGKINNIYVIVEIGGYLYLTKGAASCSHEFYTPQERE